MTDHEAKKATRAELAESSRKHYDELSTLACSWSSGIPQAIDAWEREPELLRRIRKLELDVNFLKVCYEEMTKAWLLGLEEIKSAEARYGY